VSEIKGNGKYPKLLYVPNIRYAQLIISVKNRGCPKTKGVRKLKSNYGTLQTLFCFKNYFLGPIWPKRIHLSNVALCLRFVWKIMKVLQTRFNFNCIEAWLLSNNLVSNIVDALA